VEDYCGKDVFTACGDVDGVVDGEADVLPEQAVVWRRPLQICMAVSLVTNKEQLWIE
jgi:hypothetical protein